jgi:hypothetical protein
MLTRNIDTAQLVREHSHAFQNTLNTTQCDSKPETEPVAAAEQAPEARNEPLKAEAPKPTDAAQTSNPAAETKPSTEALAETSAVNDSKASVGPKNETVTGEKRDLDSTLAAPTENKEPVSSEEREAKKQKTEEKPTKESNGTAAPSGTEEGAQRKANKPKKEKIKDAVNKIIPGDGIGSRTRSRTKGA